MNREEDALVCDLTVFPAGKRAELAATVPDMFAAAQEVQELADGYAFQFPNESGMFMALANFVEHERQCCPFYHFVLEVEPGGGPFWLRMRGGREVKAYIRSVWDDLEGAVAEGLVRTGDEDDLDEIISRAGPILADAVSSDQT